jgi:hypothetical protein
MFKQTLGIHLIVLGMAGIAYSQGSQSALVARPTLTFVLDSSHQLRPMVGIPGAASIGAPVTLGFDVTQALISPDSGYILAATSQSSWPLLVQVRGNSMSVQPADYFISQIRQSGGRNDAAVDSFALSSSGSAAAFLNQAASKLYIFTNLSQSPALQQTIDTRGLAPATALGLSDDGKSVLWATSTGDSGVLFLLKPGRSPQFISAMRHPVSIVFLHNSSTALIADDVDNAIYQWNGRQLLTFAGVNDGVSQPVGIAASNDNQRVFVGNAQSGTVTTITSSGSSFSQSQPCNCQLTGLFPTSADSVFRLTDFTGGSILLFDASGASPRTVFVPMGAE